ncbi:6800_t:CDS:2, partial [Dentiscutata erythropus]
TNTEIDEKYQELFEVLSKYYERKNFIVYAELIKHYATQEDSFDEYKYVLKYSENLSKEALTISKFFDRDKTSPNDLILSGIIFNDEIQDKQEAIYKALKDENLWDSFCLPKKDIWNDSQYEKQDRSITESTFSCHYIIHLVEFLQGYTEHTFQTAWNSAESVATKCRNNQDGPRRCPDNFWFLTSQKIKNLRYEFFYLEVSGGPFVNLGNINVKNHILENRRRIGKFCKDSWDYIYNNCKNQTKSNLILSILKRLKLFALHIYGTTLVVYIIERKFDPLFHMKELVKIALPVHKPNENEFVTFMEKLITVSDLFKQSLNDILIIEDLLCKDEDKEYDSHSSDEDTDLNILFTENTLKF